MRRRLVVLLALLMGCVLATLSVLFGRSLAETRQNAMFVDRLQDTSQFADMAQQATTSVAIDGLRENLARYSDLYGITAAVVGRGGTTWAISGPLADLDHADAVNRIAAAQVGHQSSAPPIIWPWQDDPVVVAVPVERGDNVVAVLTNRAVPARSLDPAAADAQLAAALQRPAGTPVLQDIRERAVAQARAQVRTARRARL